MAWKKVPPELAEFIKAKTASLDCEKKPMFGCPAFSVGTNMFTGAHQDSIVLRLSEADREEFLGAYDEASLFEPTAGRKMKEYVVVPQAVLDDDGAFDGWLRQGHAYAASLPQKPPKKGREAR